MNGTRLALDSMDFLRFVIDLQGRVGVNIREGGSMGKTPLVVVMVASAGGIKALGRVRSELLNTSRPPSFIVQHRRPDRKGHLRDVPQQVSNMRSSSRKSPLETIAQKIVAVVSGTRVAKRHGDVVD